MGLNELLAQAPAGSLVFLDTNVFIYHVSEHETWGELAAGLLGAVEAGTLRGMTTVITLAELLVRPAQANEEQVLLDYEAYLLNFPNLEVAPVDAAMAREAARLRGETRLPMPDAIQLAAARLYGAELIITNDRRWGKLPFASPRVLSLAAFAA